jgi:hypothetical protein
LIGFMVGLKFYTWSVRRRLPASYKIDFTGTQAENLAKYMREAKTDAGKPITVEEIVEHKQPGLPRRLRERVKG